MAGNKLPKNRANYTPLTPLTFIHRTADVYPDRLSVIYGRRRFTWSETLDRCRRVASALCSHGVSPGDTVSVVAPNVPALYELHFAVPMAGAVLNAVNFRLDARTLGVLLAHSECKLVLVDTEFLPVVHEALAVHFSPTSAKPVVVHIYDETYEKEDEVRGGEFGTYLDYEELVSKGNPHFSTRWPADEWDAISINYTSGTTSAPKGVVYHHRGAYINSTVGHADFGTPVGLIYLWTLPMFHCNGWCFTWAVAAQAGTNICLRKVTPEAVFSAISEYGVTHFCGAPTVLSMVANAKDYERRPLPHKVAVLAGGAPPAAALLAKMETMGFSVSHGYGLTESYGPALFGVWKSEWDALPLDKRATLKARQGVRHLGVADVDVLDPKTLTPVPRDGMAMGEVMLRGTTVMKGYFKAQQATDDAFRGGWFHTGDLGVMHPDGYLQLKDRSKDIIISGGENISSVEVESILYTHPHILEAGVVSCPDEFWGEIPCAFVCLTDSTASRLPSGPDSPTEEGIIEWCRQRMPRYMVPRLVVFGSLPKTITGKVQKNVLRERARRLHPKSGRGRSKL